MGQVNWLAQVLSRLRLGQSGRKLSRTLRISQAVTFLGRPGLLAVLCAILLPVSSYFAANHIVVSRALEELQATVDRETHVAPGTRVPSLTGFSLAGVRLQLSTGSSGRGVLILGLSSLCSYSLAEIDVHRRLAADAESHGLDVYWVLRDSLDDSHQGPYQRAASPGVLLVEPVSRTHRLLGLGFTPQTIVLTTKGVVDESWRGVLGANGETRIMDAIRRVSAPQADPKP